jgi:hypothetical protein
VHIAARELAMYGAATGDTKFGNAVDPEGSPFGAGQVEGHEIPAPAERHQSHRLDLPGGGSTLPVGIAEPNTLAIGRRRGERRQGLGVDHDVKRQSR